MAEWWEKFKAEQVSATLGYGTEGGTSRRHIIRWVLEGPGARSSRVLCGGMQGYVLVDTSLDLNDEAACREFLNFDSTWKSRPTVQEFRTECARRSRWMTPCPRCESRLRRGGAL